MIDLSRNGFTNEEIKEILHMKHGSRKVRFRYFLLDKNENELGEISELVESASVEFSAFSDLKRTGKFKLVDTVYKNHDGEEEEINWNTDRIQAFAEFKVPSSLYYQINEGQEDTFFIHPNFPVNIEYAEQKWAKKESGWIDFSLGVFLISSPTKVEENGNVYREIEAYDKLLIAKEDKTTDRYTISKNKKYYDAMKEVLGDIGIEKYNIENSDKKLKNDKEYEPGTEKLEILNELASDLNYTPFWVDEFGYYTTSRYRTPQEQSTDYEYKDDELSVITPGIEEELDTFDIPNVFTVVVSNPDDDEEFHATVENTNKDHPRSIPNLGRRVVRFEEKDDIADQDALDSYVERLAFESSQIYGKVKFATALMPFHSYSNVLRINNSNLGINDKYAETSWKMTLEAGADMEHEVRKVVSLV